jgi:hypothetical protein
MFSRKGATMTDTVDLLDVNQRKVIKSWPYGENAAPIEWSSDGDALVTVRDHRIVFEPLE